MTDERAAQIQENVKTLQHKLTSLGELLQRGESALKEHLRSRHHAEYQSDALSSLAETLAHIRGAVEVTRIAVKDAAQVAETLEQVEADAVDVERERAQFVALYAVSLALNSTLNLDEQLNMVMDTIIRVTGAERGFLMMVDEVTGELSERASRNLISRDIAGPDLEISRSVVRRAAENGEAILTLNAQEDPRFKGTTSVADYSLRSILCVPLCVQEQTIGAIYLDNRAREGVFTSSERDLAMAFANQAAVAIERAQLINSLETANERLRRANELKSEFIVRISHELRTPMTAIQGYLDLLATGVAGALGEMQQKFINTIRTNAARMIGLVNRLIDLSSVEKGEFELELETIDLAVIVNNVLMEMKPQFAARQLRVTTALPSMLPFVRADPERVAQIICNLLENAAKFTDEGGHIELRAQVGNALGERDNCVLVAVQDNGVGIALQDQPLVFDNFFRADNPLSIEAGGTGVGLAVTKALVGAHGGHIWLESELNKGSTFYFTLPAVKETMI